LIASLIPVGDPSTAQSVALFLVTVLVATGVLVALRVLRTAGTSVGLISRSRGDALVLLGVSGAGKTLLYYTLRNGVAGGDKSSDDSRVPRTVPSMAPNDEAFPLLLESSESGALPPKPRVEDFPGHGSQQYRLPEFLEAARSIVFVVNAASPKSFAAAAERLYEVLASRMLVAARVPVLVLCLHSDSPSAHPVEHIQNTLAELVDRKRTLQHTMKALDDSSASATVPVGTPGQQFTFEQSTLPIEFARGSAVTGELSALRSWISRTW
jgi:hypothetical protein